MNKRETAAQLLDEIHPYISEILYSSYAQTIWSVEEEQLDVVIDALNQVSQEI